MTSWRAALLSSSSHSCSWSKAHLASLLLVSGAKLNATSPMCSKCTVLLMEPSELHMLERSRREEPLHHLQHFAQTRRTEMRRVRLHLIFSSCWHMDVHRGARARPVLTGFSGGWMGPLIVNVEFYECFDFSTLSKTQASHTVLTHRPSGVSPGLPAQESGSVCVCPVRLPSRVFGCSKARASVLTLFKITHPRCSGQVFSNKEIWPHALEQLCNFLSVVWV